MKALKEISIELIDKRIADDEDEIFAFQNVIEEGEALFYKVTTPEVLEL